MEPLSYIYHREISLKKEKISVIALIVVFVFDFFLFPAPMLAANEEASSTNPSEQKLFLTSADNADNLYFTNSADASDYVGPIITEEENKDKSSVVTNDQNTNTDKPAKKRGRLPVNTVRKAATSGYHEMSAYNSEVAQCDASPCTTATGFNVCKHGIEDTVAANFLSFGTKVRIPELFGDRIFVVRDRMNSRYTDRVDVWMKNKADAIQFGVRYAKIEIVN